MSFQEDQVTHNDKNYTREDSMMHEPKSSNGLTGFVQNPYVFCTAIFASIGGILFGCKYQHGPAPSSFSLCYQYDR